jgi:hypothetical protein
MAKKTNEQIDYQGRPERMDPNLERKLADPEGLYATNPAMKKGSKDVQRLVSSRFGKVADKLKEVTGNQNISSKQVQQMIYMEMMSKVPNIMRIEARHRDELEQLAIEASLDETEVPSDWFEIEANLNRTPIDVSNFRYQEEEEEEEDDEEKKEPLNFNSSFDIEDLTDEELFELEKHKRNIINAIIQGAAKKGHYLFQKPEVKARLDEIDPTLYRDYLGIMAINDFLYFSMEQMIEMMSQTGQGVAGKVELDSNDDDEDGDEGGGDEKPDTVIRAYGLLFPILCHEIIKGVEEAKGRHGLPQNPEMAQKVMGQTDVLSNEPMQLRIGPEIVEKIRFALPDEMFEPQNKGLINWFHIILYQIPAEEFLDLIGKAISDDESKVKKATERFTEIMKEAINMKSEFDDYKEEEGSPESTDDYGGDDEDDLDDFLGSLGISRPK